MPAPRAIYFPPFRLDVDGQRLWHGSEEVPMRAKPLASLAYLAARPGHLVTNEELAGSVWGDVSVSPATLRSTLREVRTALGDEARAPRFIETVHGRGYRFVATTLDVPSERDPPEHGDSAPNSALVGRQEALTTLEAQMSVIETGHRRVVFVSGEAGIGKTTLVDEFFRSLRAENRATCVHGQCVTGYGQDDPYLPILEALGRLCVGRGGAATRQSLERHAPTWMLELTGVFDEDARRRLRVNAMRVDRSRMLHELGAALEALCTEEPLVLLFEDIHWSDAATLNAIEVLARRTETAKLLLVATHRPVEATPSSPEVANLDRIRAELFLHDLAVDLALPLLARADTEAYVRYRFPGITQPDAVADFLWERSEGNPLLFVGYGDALVREGQVRRSNGGWDTAETLGGFSTPTGLRQMVDYQLGQFSREEQELLENASVAGIEFEPEWLEAARSPVEDPVEELHRIAQNGSVLRPVGDRLAFVHDLYREALYTRASPARRRRVHRSIAEHLEREHGNLETEIPAELAMHYERAGEAERAVHYLRESARVATQRSAPEEAEELLRRAERLLADFTLEAERHRAAFGIAAQLGNALTLTKGYVAPEVRAAYERAIELAESIDDDTPDLMTALAGLHGYYELRGEHSASTQIALRQLRVADRTGDSFDRVVASLCRGTSCFSVGNYEEAAHQLAICIDTYDPERHGVAATDAATDHGVNGLGYGSLIFAARGDLARAREWSERSLNVSRELKHVPTLVLSLYYAMTLEQLLRDVDRVERLASECLELSLGHGFPYFVPATMIVSGWVQAQRGHPSEGVEQASQGLQLLRDAGATLGQPLWASMLAEACCIAGEFRVGLEAVAEGIAFVESTGEVAAEPSLHWWRGELLHAESVNAVNPPHGEIEASLDRAIASAQQCGAPAQALGPAIRLARISADRGRRSDAKRVLEEIVAAITPTRDVPVLSEAEKLLATL